MKHLLNEHTILELNCHRVSGRPAIVLENFNQYSPQEQAQINEAYNAMFDLMQQEVLHEISLSGAKAKIKGKFAGAKAAMQGDQNAGDVGQQAELQSLFDDLKTNIGTIVAQHEKDVSKLGFKPEDEISKALAQIRQTIEASPANIEIKDNSLAGKAGRFSKEKVLPIVMKAVTPVINKVTQMYENSGPIKGFDDKYQSLVSDIGQKFPALAEPLSKVSELAKQNKGKATFLIGSLTALLTITGGLTAGGIGVFALGVGLRGVFGMLAGEPPAKAFGKAAITSAIGKLVGGAFNMLFGDIDFNLFGAEETGAKAGVGELTGGEQAAEMGPVAARNAALDALQDKYPDAGSFRELMELDPEAAQELQQQFAKTGSSTSMGAAEDKIDLLMKGNEVTDAGMDSGKFVGGELQLEPSAESALLDLDAKGLTMMQGGAQGNIKDLIAWSDEYTPTGSDFESRMLADLKATDPEGFREKLFHTMSQAKEEEAFTALKSLTAAAKEAGHVGELDPQTAMELDPVTYQQYQLAQVQKLELSAAADGGSSMTARSYRLATMFRDKYNAQFPDELPTGGAADAGGDVADAGGDLQPEVRAPSGLAKDVAGSMAGPDGITTITPQGIQSIINHQELRPMFFAQDGDQIISNITSTRKLQVLQKLLLADPNLSLDDLDGVAAAMKDPEYVTNNVARADEVWNAYSTALKAGGGVDPEAYETAIAKYKELMSAQ